MADKLPDFMTKQEWEAFVATFNTKAITGLRNAAMVTVMRDAGLRVGEVIGLQVRDLREETREDGTPLTMLALKNTKGHKHRTLYLSHRSNMLLAKWLRAREKHGLGMVKTVFTTLQGQPVKDSYLRELTARKGAQAGIAWRVHPHALRHTFATELLDKTNNLALVQDALGHERPETTRIYAKVKNSALMEAMAEREVEEDPQGERRAALVTAGFTEAQADALMAVLVK